MKGKTKDIVLIGVVVLFCFLPVFSICPFNLTGAKITQYFGLWLKLLAYFVAGGIVGYILRKVTDRKLCIGYVAVTVLYIAAVVVIAMLPFKIFPFGSGLDMFAVELGMIFLLSLLVMLGYAGIDKLVNHLLGKGCGFDLSRCFIVMAGIPVILWHIDYWVNGIDGCWANNIVTLLVARKFGVVISGLVAGRMLGYLNCRTIH